MVDVKRLIASMLAGLCAAAACSTSPGPTSSPPSASAGGAPSSAAATPSVVQSYQLDPAFSYLEPPGWLASEDRETIFRVTPEGFTNDQFDQGLSDGITFVAAAAAANTDCSDSSAPGVGQDPDAIAAELLSRKGIAGTKQPVQVGGLSGVVVDVHRVAGWSGLCSDPPLINGPAFNQRLGNDRVIRLYLLQVPGAGSVAPSTVAIELDDLSKGDDLDAMAGIVATVTFVP